VYTSTAVPVFQLERFRVSSWQFVRPWTQTGRKHTTKMQRRHLFADLTILCHHTCPLCLSFQKFYFSSTTCSHLFLPASHSYPLATVPVYATKEKVYLYLPIFPGIPLLLPLIPFYSTFHRSYTDIPPPPLKLWHIHCQPITRMHH
jgi:hypothetical protein